VDEEADHLLHVEASLSVGLIASDQVASGTASILIRPKVLSSVEAALNAAELGAVRQPNET